MAERRKLDQDQAHNSLVSWRLDNALLLLVSLHAATSPLRILLVPPHIAIAALGLQYT